MDWQEQKKANLQRILREAATRTRRQEIEDDVRADRGLSDAERWRRIVSVMHAAETITNAREDADRVRAWRDPPAADFEAIWERLHAEFQKRNADH